MALFNVMAARQQVETSAGAPLGGGKVFLFAPGTSSFITSYEDSGLVTPHTNPVILNGAGRSNIWVSRDCDIVIEDRNGNEILNELNVNPDALDSGASGGLITNGSFENDIDADTIPDNWTLVNETGSTNAIDTSESTDGAQSFRFTSAGANGGGNLTTTDFFPVNAVDNIQINFDIRCTSGTPTNIVQIQWYDISQVTISNNDVYSQTTGSTFVSESKSQAPPALARFAKLKLVGVDPAGAVAASTFFDKVSVFYPAVVTGTFDNITILDNQIQSDNTNGHIQLRPNGTGTVEIFQGTPQAIDLTDEEVAVIIGAAGAQHLEFDDVALQSKASATTVGILSLNALGGNLNLGAQTGTGQVFGFRDGASVFRSLGAAAGGLEVNNTLTGAGFERALTIADIDFTANRAMISDGSGDLAPHADVSDTELGRLNGVTSDIQGQIDGKAPTAHSHTSGEISALDVGDITTGIFPVVRGGTGVASSTGSGNTVLSASPTFTGTATFATVTTTGVINVGHASDSSISRASAGKIEIEGRPLITHNDGALPSGRVHVSTSGPTGGSNGDIWLEREA